MSRRYRSVQIAGVMVLAGMTTAFAGPLREQKHEVYLMHSYRVGNAELKPGMYIVVHRDRRDKKGRPCTYFYRDLSVATNTYLSPDPSSLLASSVQHREMILSQDTHKSKFSMAIMPFRIAPLAASAPAAEVHCYPTAGPQVESFTIDSELQSDGNWRIRSIQFPGSREIHHLER